MSERAACDAGFELTSHQQEALAAADRYARTELYTLGPKMDNDESWPDAAFRKLGTEGYFGITVPVEYGGSGGALIESGLVLQAFARWNHALALSWVAHENLCTNNLYRNA